MRTKRTAVLLFVLVICTVLFCSCEKRETTENISTTVAGKQERNDIVVDLGEIESLNRHFFPETRVNRLLIKLIALPLSELIASIDYDENTVHLTLLPIRTHLGRVVSGADILDSIAFAYRENINRFGANIIDSSSEALEISITFDRLVPFEEQFYNLPIYPSSYLNGEDYDSLGAYRISSVDQVAQKLELLSNDAESPPITMIHNDFEVSKSAYESGELDVLYLPYSGSAKLWADTVKGDLIKMSSNQIYMMGFSKAVPFEQRVFLYNHLENQNYINNYMGGFGDLSSYPARNHLKMETDEELTEPLSFEYICFVDSEWSYQFYQHLEKELVKKNVYVKPIFTDFMTMMGMAGSEEAAYVYAFSWDLGAKTSISKLLGEGYDGTELDEEEENLYYRTLPVIPIAAPYDYYLMRSVKFKYIIE